MTTQPTRLEVRAKTMDHKTQMREGFEAQRKAGMNVDWFTWQIAWHDALFQVHDIAGGELLSASKPAAPHRSGIDHFNYLCSLLPEGFHWSDPLTPDVMNHIVSAAAPAQSAEPVGKAVPMPGASGFTMAVFEASEIPVGTDLYAAPQPSPTAVVQRYPSEDAYVKGYEAIQGSASVADAVFALWAVFVKHAALPSVEQTRALTDEEILALNAGEVFFSETPSKYPEAGHGTQYHCGAPGLIKFARALLTAARPASGDKT